MRLVWYEWKKLWKNASVLKLSCFLLVLSGGVFWGEMENTRGWAAEYQKLHQEADGLQGPEAAAWLEQEEQRDGGIYENYGREKALEQLKKEIDALAHYGEYRASIQQQYQQSQDISIFSGSGGQKEEDRKRTAEVYQKLTVNAPMELQPCLGIETLLDFYAGDLLTVVFLLYLSSVVFLQEDRTGKTAFACTMLHGKRRLFAAKAITVCGGITVYLILAPLLYLGLGTLRCGPVSLSMAVQSIQSLWPVPYPWTIGQYILACLGLKLLGAFLLAGLAAALAKHSGSVVLTAAGLAGAVGVGIWANGAFAGGGLQAAARIWNVWGLLRGRPVLGTYEWIRIGSFGTEAVWGLLPLTVLGLALFLLAGRGRRGEEQQSPHRIGHKRGRKQSPRSLFYYERKKLWICQGGALLFAACLLLQGTVVRQYRDYPGTDEYYYQNYIDQIGSRVTEQTWAKIAEEEARLQKIEEAAAREKDPLRAGLWTRLLECRGGFQKYVDRAEALKRDGKAGILLKDAQYSILFRFTEVSRGLSVLLCASLAFLLPASFQKEKETRVETLQRTASKGGWKLWKAKLSALLLYAIPLILASDALSLWKASAVYKLELWAPADCLPDYWQMGIKCPLIAVFAAGELLQCGAAAAALVLLSLWARRGKNQYMMMGVLLGGGVVPILLSPYLSGKWLRGIHDFLFVFTARGRFAAAAWALAAAAALAAVWKERRDA